MVTDLFARYLLFNHINQQPLPGLLTGLEKAED